MSPSGTIKFCDKIKLAAIIDISHCIDPQDVEIIKEKRTTKTVRSTYPYLRLQQPNKRTITSGIVPTTNHFAFTTTNKFNGLENDTLVEYENYKSKWMLDMAASGNYADKDTPIGNK